MNMRTKIICCVCLLIVAGCCFARNENVMAQKDELNNIIQNDEMEKQLTSMTVEEKVQEYLKLNGISQKYFAELIGISPANLTATFNGKRKMKAHELIKFCEHYGVTLDFFKNDSMGGANG